MWLDPARTSPYAFFQFWLRTGDAEVGAYLRRFTFLGPDRDRGARPRRPPTAPERRQAQRALAFEVTAMVHGEEEARRAEEAAAVLFTPGIASLDPATLEGALGDAPTTPVARRDLLGGLTVVEALLRSALATSRRQARQLLSAGGRLPQRPAGWPRTGPSAPATSCTTAGWCCAGAGPIRPCSSWRTEWSSVGGQARPEPAAAAAAASSG